MGVGYTEKQGQKAHYCSGLNSGRRAKTSSDGNEVLEKWNVHMVVLLQWKLL